MMKKGLIAGENEVVVDDYPRDTKDGYGFHTGTGYHEVWPDGGTWNQGNPEAPGSYLHDHTWGMV